MSAVDTWVSAFHAGSAVQPGAGLPWLATLRREALYRFADEGWPTRRHPRWQHTSLAFMDQQDFAANTVAPDAAAALARLRGDDAGHWLAFVGGRFHAGLSDIGALPAGVQLTSLADALDQHPEAVQAAFGSATDGDSPAALNLALATDGAWLRLPRGVALDAPVHLVFIAGATDASQHLRNLIVAEANSEATIVEHYLGEGDATTLTTATTRLQVDADARITHIKLQQEAEPAIHLANIDAVQARGAHFASHSLSFGARLARNDIHTRFDGEGCDTLLNGLYHLDGRRHVDHHTSINHAQPRGSSREFYRGLLDGNSRGVFTGRIIVAKDAQRSDAMQRCDNLLLSRAAEADARPELEIYADDVKCAHGATVGQMDEDSLFYLRTRGLDDAHARRVLTYAFAAEAIDRIELLPLRKQARAALMARLPGGKLLEELL